MKLERLQPWLLASASGLSLALALPGPGIWPLALLTPGLLRRALSGSSGWRAFRIGWVAGFAEWVVSVAWGFVVLHRHGKLAAPLAATGSAVASSSRAREREQVPWVWRSAAAVGLTDSR